MFGETFERLLVVGRRRFRPGRDGLAQPFAGIRNDEGRIDMHRRSQTVAGRTGAERIVERKQARFDFVDREPGYRTGESGGKRRAFSAFRILGEDQTVGQGQGGFQRIGQSRLQPIADNHAVDDDIDIVLEIFVQTWCVFDQMQFAVDLDTLKTAFLQIRELFPVLALAAANDRGQQVQPGPLLHRHGDIDHLADILAFDRQSGRRRIGDADSREQQSHVVVNFGYRAHRGTWISACRLLLDRDCRRQAFDKVDIRFLHEFEKLPRIGRQAFDIAALSIRVNRIESKRRFAGSGKACNDDQLVAR